MKLLYLILFGMLCPIIAKADAVVEADRHAMAVKREADIASRRANVDKVTDEAKARLLSTPATQKSEEPKGVWLEGDWNFKMEGVLYDDLTDSDWYGMLVGSTFLLEETTHTAYPIIGEFDASTNKFTISKKYVGRDWRGRYVFVHPYTLQNGRYVPGTITAQFDPTTGRLKFDPRDYLAWIDFKNLEGTEDSYDEGAWYTVMSANRIGDLDKDNPDWWELQGEATIIDGWVSPRFGREQNRPENWLKAELYRYRKNPNLYRLKCPFDNLNIDDYETTSKTGYIEFDVSDPAHVVFNRIDAGWTCPRAGINKLYCYNVLGYYLTDYKMWGENYTVGEFILYFDPFIPFTTFSDGVVDLGAILYAGEVVYDANFGDSTYPTGGNMWIGFNMRTRIYFPGVTVTEPQIDFADEPSVAYHAKSNTAQIDVRFTYANKPANGTIFVMVYDKATGRQVARKYVNASKYTDSYSFVLDVPSTDIERDYAIRVQMEGGLSEIIAKSALLDIDLHAGSKEVRTNVDGIVADGTADALPVYYNLQGARVDHPVSGQMYIAIRGNKATKVIF